MRPMGAILILLLTANPMLPGQSPGIAPVNPAPGPANDKSAALAAEFNLTPDQKAAMEAIMDEAQYRITPILEQIVIQKIVLLSLCKDGKDTARATKALAQLNAQGMAIEVAAFIQLFAKLDDKQKARGAQLFVAIAGMYGAPGGWRKSP